MFLPKSHAVVCLPGVAALLAAGILFPRTLYPQQAAVPVPASMALLPDAPTPQNDSQPAAPQARPGPAPRPSLPNPPPNGGDSAKGAGISPATQPEAAPGPPSPQAAPAGLWQRKYLFGDWNGQRTRLEDRGIVFDFYYTDDALGNPVGGRGDFGVWGRIRGTVDVDFSKFTRWQGLTFHMTGVWQYGVDLGKQYVATVVDPSSLPSAHTVRADSYYLQQYLLRHRLVLRGGQIATYDTYGNSEYGASFIDLALGYAHSNLGSAVYFAFNPAGVPAFEVKVLPTDHVYLKGMVQSEERDPYRTDPSGFSFHLGGPVVATEAGYLHDPPRPPDATQTLGKEPFLTEQETGIYPGVYRFGAGYNPHDFADPLSGRSSPGNYLLYGQIDQAVYRMARRGEASRRGLDLTYSEDYAPGDVTSFNHQIMAGGRWIGLFPGHWSKDSMGLGYVRTAAGRHYREAQLLAGQPRLSAEHMVEWNYLANVTPWLLLQPVLEWYVQPGADAARGTVFVAGFRTKITF